MEDFKYIPNEALVDQTEDTDYSSETFYRKMQSESIEGKTRKGERKLKALPLSTKQQKLLAMLAEKHNE